MSPDLATESVDDTPFTASARVRVGTDIVAVRQIEETIATFGERYLARVFTPAEVAYAQSASDARATASHLAARFAAKEAVMKVLRPGAYDALDWRAIEVVRAPGGWCERALRGNAAALARRERIGGLALSLSHEADYATAVVVAERGT